MFDHDDGIMLGTDELEIIRKNTEVETHFVSYLELIAGFVAGSLVLGDHTVEIDEVDELPIKPRWTGYTLRFTGVWVPTRDSEALSLPNLAYRGFYDALMPGALRLARRKDPLVEVHEDFRLL